MSLSVTVLKKRSGRFMMALRRSAGVFTLEPSHRTPEPSTGLPSSVTSRHWPIGLKFSRAKPVGSMVRWQPAQKAFSRCFSSLSRTDLGDSPTSFSARVGTFGGGGGGGRFNNVLRIHLPRFTGDVRVGFEV